LFYFVISDFFCAVIPEAGTCFTPPFFPVLYHYERQRRRRSHDFGASVKSLGMGFGEQPFSKGFPQSLFFFGFKWFFPTAGGENRFCCYFGF